MKPFAVLLAAALCGAAALASPTSAPLAVGLSPGNFVDVGDSVVDMLDTSGLAISTLVIGRFGDSPIHGAAFTPPSPVPLTHPFESRCPGGGSITGSMRDADASGDVSVQDRFVTTFHDCRMEGGVVTGSSEFIVASHRFDGPVEVTELEFVFKALGTDTLRWSGPARVVLRSDRRNGADHYVVRYRDLAVTRSGRASRWNFTLEVRRPPLGDDSTSIDGAMTIEGMTLHLNQDEPFLFGGSGVPRAGRLTASDGFGSRLIVEASRRGYRYSLFLRGHRGEMPDAQSNSPRAAVR